MIPIHFRTAAAFLALGALAAGLRSPAADIPDNTRSEKVAVDAHGDPLPKHVKLRLGTVRFRQGGLVTAVRYSSDGKTLVSSGDDLTVRWWDSASGKELRHFAAPAGGPLSPDGRTAATIEFDNAQNFQYIRLWDTATGKAGPQLGAKMINIIYPSLSFSPDSKVLASLEQDNNGNQIASIRLWDAATGKEVHRLQGPEPKEGQLGFFPINYRYSPDSKYVAAVGNENNVAGVLYVWDAATGKLLPNPADQQGKDPNRRDTILVRGNNNGTASQIEPDEAMLTFTPDGKYLAALVMTPKDDGTSVSKARLWEVATGKQIRDIGEVANGANGLLFDPTSRTVAIVAQDNQTVHLYDVTSGKAYTDALVQDGVVALAFAPNGKTLALGGGTTTAQLWDVPGGKLLHDLKGFRGTNQVIFDDGRTGPGQHLAFSPDGLTLAATGGAMVRRWEVATGKELTLNDAGHDGAVQSMVVSRDGKLLVTVGADNTVRFWDTVTGKQTRSLDGPAEPNPNQGILIANVAASVDLTPDGKLLAVGWASGQIQMWDTATGKELKQLKGHDYGVSAVVFSANGRSMASAGLDGRVFWWDVTTGKAIRQFAGPPPAGGEDPAEVPVNTVPVHLALAPDGRTLVITSMDEQGGYKLQMYEMSTGKPRRLFKIKGDGVAPNAVPVLAAAVAIGDQFGQYDSGYATYSPDGKTLAWTAGGTVRLWDLAKGREIRRFGVHEGAPSGATFSPDGKYLTAACRDGAVYLWDVATGTVLGHMTGHRGAVQCVAFAAGGTTLISGGADTTALLWDVPGFVAAQQPAQGELSPAQLKDLWEKLTLEDSEQADAAQRELAEAPKQALPLLRERTRPVAAPDAKLVEKLLDQLEDNRFGVRKKAEEELEKLGELAESALRKRLADNPGLEVKTRLEQLVQKMNGPVTHPERLRALRAVEVLELIGTTEAREVLQEVAKGAPDARLTQDAQAAVDRLRKAKK